MSAPCCIILKNTTVDSRLFQASRLIGIYFEKPGVLITEKPFSRRTFNLKKLLGLIFIKILRYLVVAERNKQKFCRNFLKNVKMTGFFGETISVLFLKYLPIKTVRIIEGNFAQIWPHGD